MVTHEMVREFCIGLQQRMQQIMEEGWGSDYEIGYKVLGTWYEPLPENVLDYCTPHGKPHGDYMIFSVQEYMLPKLRSGYTEAGAQQLDIRVSLADQTLELVAVTATGVIDDLGDLQADLEQFGSAVCKFFNAKGIQGIECITIQANEEWVVKESTVPFIK